MNRIILILVIIFSNSIYAQECEYLGLDKYFEKGDIAYMFGDNVRLRTAPSSESETLTLLNIGNRIEIVEKTDKKTSYNGIESPWYKVKHENEIGYVLGGLISLTQVKNKNVRCLVSLEVKDSKVYILTRLLSNSSTTYFENKSESFADNNGFCLKLFDDKGVPGISNILFINYLPESCGANSGGYYLFFDESKLYKVIDLTSSADIGFWYSEELIFPKDSLGVKDKIIFLKENGEYSQNDLEESNTDWEKSSKFKLKLDWINNKLEPNPKTVYSKVIN